MEKWVGYTGGYWGYEQMSRVYQAVLGVWKLLTAEQNY